MSNNTALGTLWIATSIHRKIVNTREEVTAKDKRFIAAGYLFAFCNLAVYISNAM